MGIIKKFKSFFDDKNDNKYYWFDSEYNYLIDNGFTFVGDEKSKVGTFTENNIKIEKKSYFRPVSGEDYYYLLTIGDQEKRFDTFDSLKEEIQD